MRRNRSNVGLWSSRPDQKDAQVRRRYFRKICGSQNLENNNKNTRPKYPFIRSILIKLEECLGLKKNTLEKLANREGETSKKENKDFIVNKFDIINTWQGSLLYFFILILTVFILKRYFILNVNVIEIQNIENEIIDK